jgi:protein-S-isoprenylcysteine O-methyltransferase Ste14
MKFLEHKIPPPAVGLGIGVLMWFLASLAAPLEVPFGVRAGIGLALLVVGVATAISGVVSFRRAKTTVNPLQPEKASSLVSSGMFQYTRNPMYLGMATALLGWAAYLASWPALLGVPLFVLYINRFQIVPEERVMASLFGADYAAYKEKVRRWI